MGIIFPRDRGGEKKKSLKPPTNQGVDFHCWKFTAIQFTVPRSFGPVESNFSMPFRSSSDWMRPPNPTKPWGCREIYFFLTKGGEWFDLWGTWYFLVIKHILMGWAYVLSSGDLLNCGVRNCCFSCGVFIDCVFFVSRRVPIKLFWGALIQLKAESVFIKGRLISLRNNFFYWGVLIWLRGEFV